MVVNRSTVIGGHMGRFPANVLDHAVHYLDRLQDTVVDIRLNNEPRQADDRNHTHQNVDDLEVPPPG